ncbi:MAG: recombination mediator RecR [Puniceicoccaceae bacterium]
MAKSFEELRDRLKGLPGLGYRSAERLALHLVTTRPEVGQALVEELRNALERLGRCPVCGNLAEGGGLCSICSDGSRDQQSLCVVETITDLYSMERSGAWRGLYHVLHGRLSPLHRVGPEDLNLETLAERVTKQGIEEVIFALPNEVECEATCHYIGEELLRPTGVKVSRIGFGLPSGGEVVHADPVTLRSALEGRKGFFRE